MINNMMLSCYDKKKTIYQRFDYQDVLQFLNKTVLHTQDNINDLVSNKDSYDPNQSLLSDITI